MGRTGLGAGGAGRPLGSNLRTGTSGLVFFRFQCLKPGPATNKITSSFIITILNDLDNPLTLESQQYDNMTLKGEGHYKVKILVQFTVIKREKIR